MLSMHDMGKRQNEDEKSHKRLYSQRQENISPYKIMLKSYLQISEIT